VNPEVGEAAPELASLRQMAQISGESSARLGVG
jgi:hypothetical protein